MGNTSTLEVRQTALSYYATLASPAFALVARWADLQAAIHAHLSRFNLNLGDIKVEAATANPGDISVACWMFNYTVVARYRLDRIEVWSNSAQAVLDAPRSTAIVAHVVSALRDVSPESRVATQAVSIAVHGSLSGQDDLAARIGSYVTAAPDGAPVFTPSGVSFLCELPSAGGRGSVVLERSAVVPDGAFLRVQSDHPGQVPEGDAVGRGVEFFQSATARLGLGILWGA